MERLRGTARMHAHTIDAAQQGFYKACVTTRALRKAGFTEAKFPHWTKKFRTTIWKSTGIKRNGDALELSGGGRAKKEREDQDLHADPTACGMPCGSWRSAWSTTRRPGGTPGTSSSRTASNRSRRPAPTSCRWTWARSIPPWSGTRHEATVITCRERRSESQGHAKRLAKIQKQLPQDQGIRRHKRLMQAKARMKAKHDRVMRDMEHKISRAVVDTAVERKAGTIAIGDVRDIADGVDKRQGQHNGRMSQLEPRGRRVLGSGPWGFLLGS